MLTIDYFSDVLCVWAYSGQIRVDELKQQLGEQVRIRYRFIPIFASASRQVAENWKDKGGYEGFNQHLMAVARQWDHVQCHPGIWKSCVPTTSTSAHVILKAVSLLEDSEGVESVSWNRLPGRTPLEALTWSFRTAFFQNSENISEFGILKKYVEQLGLSWDEIFHFIENGEAFSALHHDDELKRQYCVQGSPSFVLNDGRQILYGNVGYRIIERNILELLDSDLQEGASWC